MHRDGKAVDFLTGKMDLATRAQSGQTLVLKCGVARFDLNLSGKIAVNSLTLKNAAQSVYLFPQAEGVKSPAGVVRKDVTVHFDEVLTTSTPGVLYVYEQENEGLEVSVEAMVDGQSKVLTKTLEEKVLKRNSIYTLTLRKDTLSSEVSLDVLAWEDGGNTQLQPDLDSQITIDKNLSSLPDGVQMTANNTVTVPSRALDFTLALDCDDELEFVSSENPCVTVEAVSSGVVGENKFVVHKALFPPGYPEEEVKVFLEYLNTCSQEEYLHLWNAAYEGNDGIALKAVSKDNKITLDGWRSSESEHINKQEPAALAPDGYEMPTFNDYRSIFGAFVIPTAWAEFTPQLGGTAYRSAIILEKRSGLQLDGQDLGELWTFSVQSVKNQGEEPLTFYGVGCQWGGTGINSNWLLLACYNPGVTGWLVRGNSASLEHNGAGANNTRIVRFKKSDVEYIYQ